LREFFELEDVDSFLKISKLTEYIIRVDPLILASVYGTSFFLDLGKISDKEVGKLFKILGEKMIVTKGSEVRSSVKELLERRTKNMKR
jgi:hypothetical protein